MLRKNVVASYDVLVDEQQALFDQMSNLGREKDYKVQKIEKQYDSEIDKLIRKQQAIALQIEIAKRYVSSVGCEDAGIVSKATKSTTTKK